MFLTVSPLPPLVERFCPKREVRKTRFPRQTRKNLKMGGAVLGETRAVVAKNKTCACTCSISHGKLERNPVSVVLPPPPPPPLCDLLDLSAEV